MNSSSTARRIVFSPWLPHSICCVLVLLACIPILWPELAVEPLPVAATRYAGYIILFCVLVSTGILVITCVRHLLNMRNLSACRHLLVWLALWGGTVLVFTQMAIEADVASPYAQEDTAHPIQQSATLHAPTEKLTGPSSLVLPIEPELYSSQVLESASNLVKLEAEHETLLASFLASAPRWAFASHDNTFYTKPGHVVLAPPATGGIPGTVHATFRTVTEGERLPDGFVVATPGGAFPTVEDGMPDIALELSGKHYLLLAWRGTRHSETARKAINAAIAAIDTRMQRLADTPTEETAQRMLEGRRSYPGNKPELRVNEPNSQYGVYQAEIYANTGKAGTMLLIIREVESGKPLRLFTFPARFSSNPNELFRHDIPGTPEEWMMSSPLSPVEAAFPQGAPFFAIRTGESHQYFGVTFEVQFFPQGKDSSSADTLLRRNYKVQAYESSQHQ